MPSLFPVLPASLQHLPEDDGDWWYPICLQCRTLAYDSLPEIVKKHEGPRVQKLTDERLAVWASMVAWTECSTKRRRKA